MELTIRVGAAVDRSLSEAFRPLIQAAEKARALIDAIGKRSLRQFAAEANAAGAAAARSFKGLEAEVGTGVPHAFAMASKASRLFAQQMHADVAAAKREMAEFRRAEAAHRMLSGGRSPRGGWGSDRGRNYSRALANHPAAALGAAARSAARAAWGVGGEVLQGAGVNVDLGSMVHSNVDLEKRATDLTNSAYMPGEAGPNGKRQDAGDIIAQARQVGNDTATDPVKALEALQKFVAKTGDLQTGRDILGDMAKMARATGAELDDMVDAAADVSAALGPGAGGEAIKNVMKAIAAQGKEGAVEIKDLARQMAKLGAAAGTFTGDKSMVMAQMGAITQMSRAHGGSASATQAATSTVSFANTFSKGKRLDAFKNFGVDIYGADSKVDLRKTLLSSIKAASSSEHGGMKNFDRNMGQMFMDVRARSSTRGYEQIFKEAGGGAAGLKAVADAFDKSTAAVMRNAEIEESFARSMKTTEAKVQVFNNHMAETAGQLKNVLQPAFEALGPQVIAGAKALVDLLEKIDPNRKKRRDDADVNAELAGVNAKSRLGSVLEAGAKGTLSIDEQVAAQEEAAKAKKKLEASIAAKGKEIAEDRQNNGMNAKVGALTHDQVEERARNGSDSAAKLLRDEQQLKSLQDTLATINQRNDTLNEKLANGQIRVVIVGDTRPPEVGGAGRTPPPEHKPR
jgi:hypothetical protein